MCYITKKMIEDGLIAKAIIPKLESDGLKIYIGDCWFYCGGSEFEYTKPEDIDIWILADEIKNVLDVFYEAWADYGDEYAYYSHYLCEHI